MFKTAKLLLLNHYLCDNCLGRQFALLGYGLSNKERGIIIKNASILEFFDRISKEEEITEIVKNLAVLGNELAINSLKKKKIETPEQISTCELCGNLFGEMEIIVDKVLAKLEKEEYKSFLVGAKMPSLLIEKEDQLKAKYQITTGESIKEEFTREIGKAIFDNTKKKVDFNLPEITILIDLIKDEISLQKRSLYIYGRYKKYIRTIPQTK